MQAYPDPARETIPTSLPDIEVFPMAFLDFLRADAGSWMHDRMLEGIECLRVSNLQAAHDLAGWYWWPCFPGCLPDGDPMGPFESEALALADAQDVDG